MRMRMAKGVVLALCYISRWGMRCPQARLAIEAAGEAAALTVAVVRRVRRPHLDDTQKCCTTGAGTHAAPTWCAASGQGGPFTTSDARAVLRGQSDAGGTRAAGGQQQPSNRRRVHKMR